jgi:shikimate dehydrogenase
VKHSLSPRLFRSIFAELGVDAEYVALPTVPAELAARVSSVRSGALSGLSVTLPHKESVIPLLDRVSETASLVGAVNCVAPEGAEQVAGHNTDGYGFESALEQAGIRLSGARVLILGAGGAARAAAFAAAKKGARSLTLFNRSQPRALRLAGDLTASGLARAEGEGTSAPGVTPVAAVPALAPERAESTDLIVNATSVGLWPERGDPLPASFPLARSHAVLDMVYRPLETRLLARAKSAGAVAVDGLWMLIHQALEQFRVWTSRAIPADFAARIHSEVAKEAR